MKIQVFRLSSSSYQNESFIKNEKETLEQIPNVSYTNSIQNLDPEAKYILISNTHTQPEKLAKTILDKTILMVHPNSGYDNFSKEFIDQTQFPIIKGNPIRAYAVVEYIMGCIFSHYTQIPNHLFWKDDRSWSRKLLRDQKVLIIGHGMIGGILNRTLSSLCPNVTVYDPYKDPSQRKRNLITSFDESLFEGVELLIIAASLTRSSENLINQNLLDKLNEECVIINSARGQIINEEDLQNFLTKNPKAYAFLDVFQQEPFTNSTFTELRNINKTSHIAGVHKELNNDIIDYESLIIEEFLRLQSNNDSIEFANKYSEYILK